MGVFDLILQNLKTLFDVRVYVSGKVAMQKSLYFMKEIGYRVPFNYRWSKLGPYSQELANVLQRLTAQGFLRYTGRYELDEKHFRFVESNITPKMEKLFCGLEGVCNRNSFNNVNFIECAASLHFIQKNSHIKEKGAVFKRLAFLKPNRMSDFKPLIEHAWNFLKEQELLGSND